nr:helitron helicase-like domain-containing protein [Tanacetum cinerariifolium]
MCWIHFLQPQTVASASVSSDNGQPEGVTSAYIDIGDCKWSCEYRKARFWYGERLKGYSRDNKVQYHKCCVGGKVGLEEEQNPPNYIRQPLRNRHFLDNIRAYNQMFSMTSFGARIDDSIKNEGYPPNFLQLYIHDTQNEVGNRMQHFRGSHSGGLDPKIFEGLMHFLDEHNKLVRLFSTARVKCNGQTMADFHIWLYSVVGAREYDLPTSHTLGAIVFQNGQDTKTDYDVIIQQKDGFP